MSENKNSSNKSNKNLIWIIGGVAIAVIGIVVALIIVLSGNRGEGSDSSGDQGMASGTSTNTPSTGDLQIVDSGWSYVQNASWGNSVWYGVAVQNQNKGKVASFPTVKVVARDANDKILFSDEFTCSFDYIYYGETLYCGGYYGQQTEKPAKVEYKTIVSQWENEAAVSYPKNTDFQIKNVSEKKDGDTITYTGEIHNNSSTDIHAAHIVTIFKKNGKIVGGNMSYSNKLSANDSDTFQDYISNAPDYDTYEITAHVSMIN